MKLTAFLTISLAVPEHRAVPGLVLLPSSIWAGTENFSINYGVLAGLHSIILML